MMKSSFYQKYPQFQPKMSASIACRFLRVCLSADLANFRQSCSLLSTRESKPDLSRAKKWVRVLCNCRLNQLMSLKLILTCLINVNLFLKSILYFYFFHVKSFIFNIIYPFVTDLDNTSRNLIIKSKSLKCVHVKTSLE